ncbi:hypothetical protein FHS52_003178 [Erythromicrobium ramosum]|uniref:Uncharacterized protein n=1 Tax=Erythrobacter ramosus TaxID=35811 RepID=A0ABR6I2P5_9SPHN|nr:hypothetical protein [Erythrobacter ramosus]
MFHATAMGSVAERQLLGNEFTIAAIRSTRGGGRRLPTQTRSFTITALNVPF